ncbi:MAG: rhodanese-like domain-containing protein [Elusimicrobia bacterium]|nr:rhodanese-like domain-containing protein [Candidatus Liberimonas magnetica]
MNLQNIGHVLIAVILVLFLSAYIRKATDPAQLNSEKAFSLIQSHKDNKDFVIIDMRTPEEFSSGHIQNAVNIDFYGNDFKAKVSELDKNKTYFIYCRSGNRSGLAFGVMKKADIKSVYNLKNGILDWDSEKYPLVR